MNITLLWAEDEGQVIGNRGVLPWHIPEDLAHFTSLTMGGAVIMGRKTWYSIPDRFQPLPGRRNIVLTRQREWSAGGTRVAHSFEEALELAGDLPVWVIGGAEVFALAMDRADALEITRIRAEVEGDTFAPAVDARWHVVHSDPEQGWHRSRTGFDYRFIRYERDEQSSRRPAL